MPDGKEARLAWLVEEAAGVGLTLQDAAIRGRRGGCGGREQTCNMTITSMTSQHNVVIKFDTTFTPHA